MLKLTFLKASHAETDLFSLPSPLHLLVTGLWTIQFLLKQLVGHFDTLNILRTSLYLIMIDQSCNVSHFGIVFSLFKVWHGNFSLAISHTIKKSRSGWLSVLRRCLPCWWPGFDPRSQPDLQLVWERWLFSVTLRRGHVLKHCNWDYTKVKKLQKLFPRLEAWEYRIQRAA
jgi:hypothetical protein